MADVGGFNSKDAKEIGKAVRKINGINKGGGTSGTPNAQGLTWVFATLTGNESGAGKYQAKSLSFPTGGDIDASGGLTADEIGDENSTVDVRFLNLDEVGKTTHALVTGQVVLGVLRRINTDQIKVVAGFAIDGVSCG